MNNSLVTDGHIEIVIGHKSRYEFWTFVKIYLDNLNWFT